MISSRTPEGWDGRCAVCGQFIRIDPSTTPTRDAPCPHCGTLAWFAESDHLVLRADDLPTAVADWEDAGRPRRVVFDLSDADVVPSEYLGQLIRLHQRLTQVGGLLRVCGMSEAVLDVFRLTRLDRMLHLGDDDPPPDDDLPPEDEELEYDDDEPFPEDDP